MDEFNSLMELDEIQFRSIFNHQKIEIPFNFYIYPFI